MIQSENDITTAQIADAGMRLKIPFQVAPTGIKPVEALKKMIYGPAIPVRHYGSVDVFLEVLESATENAILTIDNGGRHDEACIGDLVVLEVKNARLKAIVLWGLHRDTNDLVEIGLPVFSYGAYLAGPSRIDPRESDVFNSAKFGNSIVTRHHTVFADQDGVMFVESVHVEQLITLAKTIRHTEREQAIATMQGLSLRKQFQFSEFLEQRDRIEGYTFRKHLSSISKAIEE